MKDRDRLIGNLFLFLAVLLGLTFLACVLLAIGCFHTAWRARELYPWLVSETEPGAQGAMNTLEEMRFKWILAGLVCLLPGLGALAGGVVLARRGRKRWREGRT